MGKTVTRNFIRIKFQIGIMNEVMCLAYDIIECDDLKIFEKGCKKRMGRQGKFKSI